MCIQFARWKPSPSWTELEKMIATSIFLSGTLVGLSLGLTGAGGSIVAVPLLMTFSHWSPQQATPVALIAVVAAAAIGAVEASFRGLVRHRAGCVMGVMGIVAAPLGVYLGSAVSQTTALFAFGIVFMAVAMRLLLQTRFEPFETGTERPALSVNSGWALCRRDPGSGRIRWTSPCAAVLGATGALAGMLAGSLGIGGGFVIIPALRQATELKMQETVATSLMVIALVGSGALSFSLWSGVRIPVAVATPFVVGAVGGMLAGRRAASRIAGPYLQAGFAILLVLMSVSLFVRAIAVSLAKP
jgi:uncharacterized protein